ncbi:MAG: spiro-SPASM protein, partial [bacterium]|nr:spiro-SPASM protein [bacterium]
MKDALIIDLTLPLHAHSSEYLLKPLTDRNSLEIILEKAGDTGLDAFLFLPSGKDSGLDAVKAVCEKSGIKCHIPSAEVRNTRDLLAVLHQFVSDRKIDNIMLVYGDSPFLDTDMAKKLLQLHRDGLSEYTFGDNFAEGLVPEVMSKEFLGKIRDFEYKKPDVASRRVFDCMNADINKFFIDLEISEHDFSIMRMELTAGTRRNWTLLKNLAQFCNVRDNHKKVYEAIRSHPEVMAIFPRYVEIEITSQDNMKCSFCSRSLIKREARPMDAELYKKVVRELTEEYDDIIIDLSLMGEPLLHPGCLDLVDYTLKETKAMNLILETNGLLFDKAVADKLSVFPAEKLTVIFGLDSLKEETYRALRKPDKEDAFKTVKENILYFIRRNDANKLRTFVQILKMKENNLELEEFYNFWQNQGIQVIIQKYNTYAGLLEDRSVVDLTPLDRIPCWHLQRDLQVFSSGDVPLCKQDVNASILIGNVRQESIRSIWEKMKKY